MGTYKITSPQCSGSATITVRRTRSRIEYRGNGNFHINIENLNRVTRNNFRIANNNPQNWEPGNVGICTKVGTIQIPTPPVQDDMFPFGIDPEHTRTRTVGENARSTGLPDRRVGRDVPTVGGGANTPRVGAGAMIAINIAITGIQMWNTISAHQDLNAIRRQRGLLESAADEVGKELGGLVPLNYLNQNDLGAIINYVFQGINETGNQNISVIGNEILRKIGRYDNITGEVKPFLD
jgi:hypothetical protein